MVGHEVIAGDLRRVLDRWPSWLGREHVDPETCAKQALDWLASPSNHQDETRPHVALVTKQPHGGSPAARAAIVTRVLAIGASLHSITDIPSTGGERAVRALYPRAWSGYRGSGLNSTDWQAIESRFAGPAFEQIFGVAFDSSLVRPSYALVEGEGVSASVLRQVWSEGRRPIGRADFESRYGRGPTERVFGAHDRFDWFHNPRWPLGIQRIGTGLRAFALRDERLGEGPVIVLNGHYLGLADLFQGREGMLNAAVIEIGVPDEFPIQLLRRWLVGESNDPLACRPGSIRRDAATGDFPASAAVPVSPHENVVHCSDGFLAGLMEIRRLLGGPMRGRLPTGLRRLGYDDDELDFCITSDPVVATNGTTKRLSEWTASMPAADCLGFLSRVLPPTFSRGNAYGAGVCVPRFAGALQRLRRRGAVSGLLAPSADEQLPAPAELPSVAATAAYEQRGIDLMASGGAGLLIPAGGTGGRFGGYDLAEGDPRRQKLLQPLFELAGAARSCLDIRVANARYWARRTGGSIRLGMMSSPASRAAIERWTVDQVVDLPIDRYEQPAIYRFDAQALAEPRSGRDPLARRADGTPLVKPPGSLGVFVSFVLSGLFDNWEQAGVELVILANGDDSGFRIDPGLLGWMAANRHVDATLLAVPRAYRLTTADGTAWRGDIGGWCVSADGREWPGQIDPEQQGAVFERRGALARTADGRWAVAEHGVGRRDEPARWFNTNQLVIRTSALRRVLLTDPADPVASVRTALTTMPLYAERKSVNLPEGPVDVVELVQPAVDVVRGMAIQPMARARWAQPGRWGGFAALKEPSDVPFAQLLLAALAAQGDQLLFAPADVAVRRRNFPTV